MTYAGLAIRYKTPLFDICLKEAKLERNELM